MDNQQGNLHHTLSEHTTLIAAAGGIAGYESSRRYPRGNAMIVSVIFLIGSAWQFFSMVFGFDGWDQWVGVPIMFGVSLLFAAGARLYPVDHP